MRRSLAIAAALSIVLGIAGVVPARATHDCADPSCTPASVAVIEGLGFVCDAAKGFTNPKCTYHRDALYSGSLTGIGQGLYWPGVGPGAQGPFSFTAGPTTNVPSSICVSSSGGPACRFASSGQLHPGDPSTLGAYCGSSKGVGSYTFVSGDGTLTYRADFGWRQSAATILPLQGEVKSPAALAGATMTGFTSSRGTSGGGNCGITQPTTQFQVEGMITIF